MEWRDGADGDDQGDHQCDDQGEGPIGDSGNFTQAVRVESWKQKSQARTALSMW